MVKKLYRSRIDRIIAGVCGGLGEFFSIDPVLFRIIFVVLALTGGSGILIYIIMMLIIPKEENGGVDLSKEKVKETIKESAENLKKEIKRGETGYGGKKLLAFIVIAIGFIALFHELLPSPWFRLDFIGPLLIIFIGLLVLFKN